MNNLHKWERIVGGFKCQYCDVIRVKRYENIYDRGFVYIDEERNLSLKTSPCKGKGGKNEIIKNYRKGKRKKYYACIS